MILYHGTNTDFDIIDLTKCEPFKDFGTGFYLTSLYDQAVKMAIKKSRIYGGNPCVITYEVENNFLSNKSYNVKIFKSTTKEWAVFIINNRNRDFENITDKLCNRDNKYDIVFGPVANDTLTTIIQKYNRGYIDSKTLIKEMRYTAPSNQYSFHTEKSLTLLKKVDSKWIELNK